ncbi:unnamed protein product [Cylindrotheca closterium]|uniref:Rab proteins geranylgeranyltransferase component A n=1 Tax=Cylindrotheca closterium TaxID=2856 RepID=A0AAD2CP63_9STRA|nr:unnamed protein product [Cylindrotheca closterium]
MPKDDRDEEGLRRTYDVVVCGTGLVQAIVSAALARAGLSVLHCDGSDYYGEMDSTWNPEIIQEKIKEKKSSAELLAEVSCKSSHIDKGFIAMNPKGSESNLQWHSENKVDSFGLDVGILVDTPFGKGTVVELPKSFDESIVVALEKWVLANGKRSLVYFRIPHEYRHNSFSSQVLEELLFQTQGVQSLRTAKAKRILNDHRISLDATPAFVLASGRAVSGMLASNVADYLEFRSAEGLFWLEGGDLSKVPCSKNDVFGTKLLAPMDKRRLMKFIQLAMDYATQTSSDEERQQQVSLETANAMENSPDAPTSTLETVESEVQSLNERHLNHGRSLARPQNKVVSTEALSILKQCMDDGMAFDTFLEKVHKLSPKLQAIVRYAIAWEREVSSVSLAEGMENLKLHLQAVGRFGNTAFIFPLYGSGELPQAFCRSAAVFGATFLLRRAAVGIKVSDGNGVTGALISEDNSSECKMIECKTIIASEASFSLERTTRSCKRILRRISVLSGRVIRSDDTDCHITTIPPKTVGNSHTIHCVTLDHTLQVVHHGCTVMHLTTTVECDKGQETDDEILSEASRMIIEASGSQLDEVYQVCFSHCFEPTGFFSVSDVPEGLHLCHHSGQALTVDNAFAQAESIFSKICPGKDFLKLSEDFDVQIKERATENNINDDEKNMLESALDIVRKTKENKNEQTRG